MMNVGQVRTTVVTVSGRRAAPRLVERRLDRFGDLDGVGVRGLGHGQRQRRLAVGARVARRRELDELDRAELAEGDRRRRGGGGGAASARRRRGRDAAGLGRPGRTAWRRDGRRKPTTRSSTVLDRVELAGRRDRHLRAIGGELAGRQGQVVRLQHAGDLRDVSPAAATFSGSSVTWTRGSRPPVRSAPATPSSEAISGTISSGRSRARRPGRSRRSPRSPR